MTATLALAALSLTLNGWVSDNADARETVLCKEERDGEYFFVAREGDAARLRLGTRLEILGPDEWSVAWILRDETGRSLTAKVPPTEIRRELLRGTDRLYFENVEYQSINPGSAARLHVEVEIRKNRKRYRVPVCEVAL